MRVVRVVRVRVGPLSNITSNRLVVVVVVVVVVMVVVAVAKVV